MDATSWNEAKLMLGEDIAYKRSQTGRNDFSEDFIEKIPKIIGWKSETRTEFSTLGVKEIKFEIRPCGIELFMKRKVMA